MTKPTKEKDAMLGRKINRFMWSQGKWTRSWMAWVSHVVCLNHATFAAYHELYPLAIGGAALMISSYSNQAVPTLAGKLLDPASRSKNNGTSLAASVVWVGLIGGTASFLRTLMLNQAKERIAARLRKSAFASLMTRHDLEWFQVDDNEKNAEALSDGDPKESQEWSTSTAPSTSLGMTPGAIAVILKEDVEAVADTMTTTLANLFRSSSSVFFSSFNMILLNPSLFGLSLAVAPAVGSIA
jgi:ABC-type multidrug transport system fused ATPase/permease subunit